jgi:transposase
MIAPPAGTSIWIAACVTDMRRGFDGLAALVQTQLEADPFSGQIFAFRGWRGDRIKLLWWGVSRTWEWASRSPLAGDGFKPPSAAAFKRRDGERPLEKAPITASGTY